MRFVCNFLRPNFAPVNLRGHPERMRYREALPVDIENLTNTMRYLGKKLRDKIVKLFAHTKLHRFRLIPKVVIMNDLTPRNGRYYASLHPKR